MEADAGKQLKRFSRHQPPFCIGARAPAKIREMHPIFCAFHFSAICEFSLCLVVCRKGGDGGWRHLNVVLMMPLLYQRSMFIYCLKEFRHPFSTALSYSGIPKCRMWKVPEIQPSWKLISLWNDEFDTSVAEAYFIDQSLQADVELFYHLQCYC